MKAWRGWRTCPAAEPALRFFPPRLDRLRSRRWPASCRPSSACPFPGSAARSSGGTCWAAGLVAEISGYHDLALAPRGRDPSLEPPQLGSSPGSPEFGAKAAPVLDLYHGGAGGASRWARPTSSSRSTRRPAPDPPPPASDHVAGPGPPNAGGARVHPPRHLRLPGRVGRPPSPALRPGGRGRNTIETFDRFVARGHDRRALRGFGRARLLGRRQRHRPPGPALGSTASRAGGPPSGSSTSPVHASWLNQIEIYFSILQRKALTAPMTSPPARR